MRTLMLMVSLLGIVLEVKASLAAETTKGEIPEKTGVAVKLTELGIRPKAPSYTDRWVELHNCGVKAVDISGWCIRDFEGNSCRIPLGQPPLLPSEYIAIVFGEKKDQYAPEVRLVVIEGEAAERIYATVKMKDECALFRPEIGGEMELVDYVRWGYAEKWADEGLSPVGRIAQLKGLTTEIVQPLDPRWRMMERGESVGRIWLKNGNLYWWEELPADNVSPGVKNSWPDPMLNFESSQSLLRDNGKKIIIWWFGAKDSDWKNHLQIALDNEMKRLLIDDPDIRNGCNDYVFKVGVYYCRVRCEGGRDRTGWSKIGKFVIHGETEDEAWESPGGLRENSKKPPPITYDPGKDLPATRAKKPVWVVAAKDNSLPWGWILPLFVAVIIISGLLLSKKRGGKEIPIASHDEKGS